MKRRDFLNMFFKSGLAYQFSSVFNVLAQEVVKNKLAIEQNSGQIQNYIQFNFYGAPTRWLYDNPLSPYGEDYIRNPFVGTNFRHQDKFKDDFLDYTHVNMNGVQMPYLWSQRPLNSTKEESFSELSKNFASIKGVWVGIDGHIPASSKILRDNDGGAFNDLFKKRGAFIDGVVTGAPPTVDYDPLHKDFELFFLNDATQFENTFYDVLNDAKGLKDEAHLEKIVTENLEALGSKSKHGKQRIEAIKEVVNLRKHYVSEYPKIYLKYLRIFEKSKLLLNDGKLLGGVFDWKLSGIPIFPVWGGRVLNRFNSRFHIFTEHSDIVDGFKSVNMNLWIHQFAIAEFLLANDLTSSAILGPKDVGNIFENFHYQNVLSKIKIEKMSASQKGKQLFFKEDDLVSFYGPQRMDAHNTGGVLNMMSKTYFFYVFHSCLNELVGTLKKHGIFDKTLIHVASEFDRMPKANENGSIHNGRGQNHSFYSGSINGPFIIGDTERGEDSGSNFGTCNTGAKHRELKRFISYRDVHATLKFMLSGKRVSGKDATLFKKSNRGFEPSIGRSKLV